MDVFNLINQFILFVLELSTLIGILDYVGILPTKIKKWLRINRMKDSLLLLEQLGIDVEQYQRFSKSLRYPKKFIDEDITVTVKKAMEKHKIEKKISVGHHRPIEMGYYYDLIGATCDMNTAQYYAQILSTFWSLKLVGDDKIEKFDYDFVVTPKGGSPILGYEYAKLVNKPFILHEETKRFKEEDDMRSVFDCYEVPPERAIALIVDDSTTGGTMVCKTIDDLHKYGYQVFVCFVVFEPKNKNARSRLLDKNVQLLSIVKTHQNPPQKKSIKERNIKKLNNKSIR